jgi:molybdopterin converting factor small subunit
MRTGKAYNKTAIIKKSILGGGNEGTIVRVKVQALGIIGLLRASGGYEWEMELISGTVQSLVDELVKVYGQAAREALLKSSGELADEIQILLNGEKWVYHDSLDTTLKEGDVVTIMLPMAGG